jgi:putative ABC transport system permease protein
MRSVLAIIGIVIGIAAVLIVVAVAEGARAEISKQIASLGSNLLLIQPGAQVAQGVRQPAGSSISLTTADALAVAREVPEVVIAAPFVGEQKTVVSGDLNWSTLVAGVTPDFFDARGWTPSIATRMTSCSFRYRRRKSSPSAGLKPSPTRYTPSW